MSSAFQTAVETNVSSQRRRDAIDSLVADDDRTSLSVLVQTGGLRGEFRRYALEGLGDCDGGERLADLAEDTSIDPSLRRRAAELVPQDPSPTASTSRSHPRG